jgi:hypothetical protein
VQGLLEELLEIGRQVRDRSFSASGYMYLDENGSTAKSSRAQEIGRELDGMGGMDAMLAAHQIILERIGGTAARELEVIWDDIGGWLG